MQTDFTLDDLILLAEAMGWKRQPDKDIQQRQMYPGDFRVVSGRISAFSSLRSHWWNPYEDLGHAGMLTRALGIGISPLLLGDEIIGWEAFREDPAPTVLVRVEGNTEAAQCKAVCGAALQIVRGKG